MQERMGKRMRKGIKGIKGTVRTVLVGGFVLCLMWYGGSRASGESVTSGETSSGEETQIPETVPTDHFILDKTEEFLTEEDVADMSAQILAYAKYEILARCGMKFDSPELNGYFSGQSWYFGFIPETDFPEGMLDDIAADNLAFLEAKQEQVGIYETDAEGYSYEPVESYVAEKEAKQAALTDESQPQPVTETAASSSGEYIFPDTDQRILSESEISALSLQAVCYAKNEIYARHGRKFLSQELQDYFNSKSWYTGTIEPADFSDAVFNSFELENIQLLSSREMALSGNSGYALDQPGYNINSF